MALVNAYDKTTGEKLKHQVPERFIGHPIFGPNLSKTPRQKASDTPRTTPKSPASGSNEKE